jgi:hypothetical protein
MKWLYLGMYLLLHLPILGLLYVFWIQHERGGWWKLCHVFGAIGFLPDVLANYTTLALIFYRWPGRAFTFSKHLLPLSRLPDWRGSAANIVADVLDDLAPSGDHIHR